MFFLCLLDLVRIPYTPDLSELVHYYLFQVYSFVSRHYKSRPPANNNCSDCAMDAHQLNANTAKTPTTNDITSNMMSVNIMR